MNEPSHQQKKKRSHRLSAATVRAATSPPCCARTCAPPRRPARRSSCSSSRCTDLSREHASYDEFREGFFLTGKQMDWYRHHYLGDRTGDDVRVSPLLAEDLAGLPPAYVAVSGFDVLRDEGEAYALRLADAGVPVALRRHDGLVHAFVNATGVGRTGREAMLEACGALRLGVGAGLGAAERARAPR